MLSDGAKVRAQIDTESVRNVLLVNGGGCIALLALLPAILGTPLVTAVLLALSIWLLGLTLAVVHSILRRKCSLAHEHHKMSPPHGNMHFGINPKQPWVCWWSWACIYSSIATFLIGGIVMVSYAFANIDALSHRDIHGRSTTTSQQDAHNNSLQRTALTGHR